MTYYFCCIMKIKLKFCKGEKMNSKKKISKLFSGCFAFIVFVAGITTALAQGEQKIKVSADEAKAVKKIEEAKTLEEKIQATEAFIQKYPKSPARSQAANYLAAQITQLNDDAKIVSTAEKYMTIFSEPGESDFLLPRLAYSYVQQKRYKEGFNTAEKYLAQHPEEVTLRLQLAIEGANLARSENKEFVSQSRDYAQKSIELIEANKKPANLDDARWQEYQTKWLPQLYQSLGFINFNTGDTAAARANFEKSAKLNPNDVNNWVMLGTIINEEYQDLAKKHTVASVQEQKELLQKATDKLDQVIPIYARIIALTEDNPAAAQINRQVREDFETYYKYRHKNSTEGMKELIEKYKTQAPLSLN